MWFRRQVRPGPKSTRLVLEEMEGRCLLSYTVTDLGTLGGRTSQAYGINNLGQVVGQSLTEAGAPHAFLWDDVQGMQDLGTLTGTGSSSAAGINDQGQVVGYSSSPGSASGRAFLWDAKSGMQPLPTLDGDTSGRALAINQKGQVVGWSGRMYYFDGHAVLWDGDKVTVLDPDDRLNVARGLNNYGQVAGQIGTPLSNRAFLWDNGTLVDVGSLDDNGSGAVAVNDLGEVVGTSLVPFDVAGGTLLVSHPFYFTYDTGILDLGTRDCSAGANGYGGVLAINNFSQIVGYNGCVSFNGGVIHDESSAAIWDPVNGWQNLQDLIPPDSGWSLAEATAINDQGQIVGFGLIDNHPEAFLLNPDEGGAPHGTDRQGLAVAAAGRELAGRADQGLLRVAPTPELQVRPSASDHHDPTTRATGTDRRAGEGPEVRIHRVSAPLPAPRGGLDAFAPDVLGAI